VLHLLVDRKGSEFRLLLTTDEIFSAYLWGVSTPNHTENAVHAFETLKSQNAVRLRT
jgi:hypothetical protein